MESDIGLFCGCGFSLLYNFVISCSEDLELRLSISTNLSVFKDC